MTIKTGKLKKLGKNIREKRLKKGYTQEILAEKLGVSREHLAKIETGTKGSSLNLLFLLAEKLDTSLEKLFQGL